MNRNQTGSKPCDDISFDDLGVIEMDDNDLFDY